MEETTICDISGYCTCGSIVEVMNTEYVGLLSDNDWTCITLSKVTTINLLQIGWVD